VNDREVEERRHLELAGRIAGLDVRDFKPPASHRLDAQALRLHYVDWGGSAAAPIVFLHGGCLTARTWDVVCLAMRQRHRCLALDLRGHGDSDWSAEGDYAFDAHVGDIARFVDHLRLERFVLVGQSLGGASALSYAARHAERTAALVLVDVGPNFRKAGGEEIRAFVAGVPRESSLDDFIERAVFFNPLRDQRLLRRSLEHNLRRLPDGRWRWKYDPRLASRLDVDDMGERMRALWGAVRRVACPTLVIRGALSRVLLDEDAATLAGALPDGRWCRIEDAGHNVQGDNPKALAAAIEAFLEASACRK
jgi:pimeloyl-ACP methyl ester carboxylesterase